MSREIRDGWFAPAATALALLACYGTLVTIALLGLLGVSIALNETVWGLAIVGLSGLTLLALLNRLRRHGRRAPVVMAVPGFLLIGFAMLISYDRLAELAGFGFLCAGAILDWRIVRTEGRQERR